MYNQISLSNETILGGQLDKNGEKGNGFEYATYILIVMCMLLIIIIGVLAIHYRRNQQKNKRDKSMIRREAAAAPNPYVASIKRQDRKDVALPELPGLPGDESYESLSYTTNREYSGLDTRHPIKEKDDKLQCSEYEVDYIDEDDDYEQPDPPCEYLQNGSDEKPPAYSESYVKFND